MTTYNTISGSDYIVDIGTSTTSFTTTTGVINTDAAGIVSTSYITNDQTALYTLYLNPEHNIPAGGYMDFEVPVEV